MIDLTKPVPLDRAGAWRTYTGGSLIDKLHGIENSQDTNFPEEWIMSTVRARNSGREHIIEGLSMVAGTDISLAELIERYPDKMLGVRYGNKEEAAKLQGRKQGQAENLKEDGKQTADNPLGVLVKLIDSAERLTVQVHPTREKAGELFHSAFGKTECWHILGGREINGEKPCIYFGFKEGITREYWQEVFDTQDIPAMLNCLHKFETKPGDTFLIEGGIPHAIGAGCFLIEVQEPTDYTIRTEKTTPGGLQVADFMCHQGLGFDRMFDCFTYEGYTQQEVLDRWCIKQKGRQIIGYDSTEMFRLEMVELRGEECFESCGSFSGIYILEGSGMMNGIQLKPGDQFFIPAACEAFTVEGNIKFIRFYGPKED